MLAAKLAQIASGTIYVDDQHNYEVIHENKLDYCEHIINTTGDNILIAYHFQSDEKELLKRFPTARTFDGTAQMMADWNAGRIPIMLLQPAANAQGINLQDGGPTLIWYTVYPNLEHYIQTNARLYRQGQKNPVVIHHLISERTVDERNLGLIQDKDMNQQSLLEAVRVTIEEATK